MEMLNWLTQCNIISTVEMTLCFGISRITSNSKTKLFLSKLKFIILFSDEHTWFPQCNIIFTVMTPFCLWILQIMTSNSKTIIVKKFQLITNFQTIAKGVMDEHTWLPQCNIISTVMSLCLRIITNNDVKQQNQMICLPN